MKVITGMDCIAKKILILPNVRNYEVNMKTEDGFVALVEMEDGFEFKIRAYVLPKVYPSTVLQLIEKTKYVEENCVLISKYISERTAEICEKNGMGYFDYVGNCWFVGHGIYISERGNKNTNPEDNKAISIFGKSSSVSAAILREIFADLNKQWKIKHLSEKVGCSIGQVSKVMNYLIENVWAKKTKEGYLITEPESILKEWSKGYGKKLPLTYSCYSLDRIAVFESKLKQMKKSMGIEAYLTGFSGGVRYTPVVRYNKVHVYMAPEDILEAVEFLNLKEVDSGANVIIYPLENKTYVKDCREIGGDMVVSPVQIYLDCMQLKGRGEEMAEAILQKEIRK